MKFKLPSFKIRISTPWMLSSGAVLCLGLWSFAGVKQQARKCNRVQVSIKNLGPEKFLDAKLIEQDLNRLEGQSYGVVGRPWYEIDLGQIERHLNQQDFVEHAEAWKDQSGTLHLDVWQMKPIARLLIPGAESKYIDANGNNYPVSPDEASRVLIVDGYGAEVLLTHINQEKHILDDKEVKLQQNEKAEALFELVKKIHTDPLLSALITQLSIAEDGDITMYPQIGHHVIEFGDALNADTKFAKLKTYYHRVVKARGWDRYKTVNLKYENLIVCE